MIGLCTIAALSKLRCVDTRQLRRLIQTVEAKHGKTILSKPNPKAHYLVDLAELHSAEPSVFAHVQLRSVEARELHERLDELTTRVDRLE